MNLPIIESVVLVAGGLIYAYFSIKKTKGTRERAFAIRFRIAAIIGSLLFAAVLFVPQVPSWIFAPFLILFVLGLLYGDRRQKAIRREEQTNA